MIACVFAFPIVRTDKKVSMQRPGIEPWPPAWQARILPLNQRCLVDASFPGY